MLFRRNLFSQKNNNHLLHLYRTKIFGEYHSCKTYACSACTKLFADSEISIRKRNKTFQHFSRINYKTMLHENNSDFILDARKTRLEMFVSKSGFLEPYLRLMRLNKPIGTWLLFWPFSWSIALAAPVGGLPDLWILSSFGAMAFLMRGAGCTLNDMWDKEIDSKIDRTKNRPLAKDQLSRFDALVFLGGQMGIGCLILLQFNFYTILLSSSSLALAAIYPLMKRFVSLPQLILGMAMNWGALIGFPAVCGISNWPVTVPLYLAGICWTIVYDTIYAFQDMKDDEKLGLKSTALLFKDSPKAWLGFFSVSMISSLATCGALSEQTWPYYCCLLAISTHLARQIVTLDINAPKDCENKFISNQNVGLLLFLGIVFANLLKSSTKENKAERSSS